ncbi:MAG: hypothetical protein Q7U02_12035 [Desulfosalsimonadaceae bacterium]|nr:hypothetical protein [Desulfosalsimonadaceae bacterium]
MRKGAIQGLILLVLFSIVLVACAVLRVKDGGVPESHPIPLEVNRPQCTDCHDKTDENFPYIKFNHDVFYLENHRVSALTSKSTCYMCHGERFCAECHGGRLELKPSLRKPADVDRRMPHRGDYLARHQIEGRVNPVSCYRCHGNPETAERCVKCHGK